MSEGGGRCSTVGAWMGALGTHCGPGEGFVEAMTVIEGQAGEH